MYFHNLCTTFRLCLEAFTAFFMEAPVEAAYAEVHVRFHGSFHRGFHGSVYFRFPLLPLELSPLPWHGSVYFRFPLLSLELAPLPWKLPGACFASVEASTCSVIDCPVRWKLSRKRWKLPWQQWNACTSYLILSFRGRFHRNLPWKIPLAPPGKNQGAAFTSTRFHVVPRTTTYYVQLVP